MNVDGTAVYTPLRSPNHSNLTSRPGELLVPQRGRRGPRGAVWCALSLLLVCAACAGSGEGDLQVNYQYRGLEAPEFVNVYLVDTFATQLNCRSIRDPRRAQPWSTERNLPAQGVSTFIDVPAGQGWMVYAVAFAQGSEVASACKDNIRIPGGRLLEENIVLQAEPLRLQGRYEGLMNLRLSDSSTFANSITAGGVLCGLVGNPTTRDMCQVLRSLASVISTNTIKAAWNLNSFDTRANGSMEFIEISGVPVGNRPLVRGTFAGSIAGRNKLVISNLNMTVNTDEYVRFLLTEVLRIDFSRYSFGIDLVLREVVGTMRFTSAEFTMLDTNFNDVADSISGHLDAETNYFGIGGGAVRVDNVNATRVSTQLR